MMVVFWIVLILMLFLALIFILWPFFQTKTSVSPSHKEANIQLYKKQLAQLDEDLETRTVTPAIYRQLKKEIERGLLQDVVLAAESVSKASLRGSTTSLRGSLRPKQSQRWIASLSLAMTKASLPSKQSLAMSRSSLRGSLRPKQSSLLAIFLVLFIPIFSISIYLKLGDSNNLKKYYVESAHAAEINAEIKQFKSPQQLINKMLTVLQQHPNSAEGWFLLGRLYAGTEQLNLAEQAYTKAILFAPNHLNYKLQYAETDFFLNQQKLSKQAQEYLTEVIAKQPNNPEAINLVALAAYSSGNYQTAINNWEKLLNYFPASSSEGQVIMRAIHQAQLHIG